MNRIRIGTRGSDLARWQANTVAALLREKVPAADVETVIITTRGDIELDKPLPEIGGKGLFTYELERAMRDGEIDCAVHSLKDLPTDDPPDLITGAVPARANPADALISRAGYTLATLPDGATVGTSSLRRGAQLRHMRPDIQLIDIRGNVPTRIDKANAADGPYDAIVLARAGVERLELTQHISDTLPMEAMLPAPGQGALAVQCRADDADFFAALDDASIRLCVTAERAFLNELEGGCSVPVAAYCQLIDGMLTLRGRVTAVDGSRQIDVTQRGAAASTTDADALGRAAARDALAQGAAEILDSLTQS